MMSKLLIGSVQSEINNFVLTTNRRNKKEFQWMKIKSDWRFLKEVLWVENRQLSLLDIFQLFDGVNR